MIDSCPLAEVEESCGVSVAHNLAIRALSMSLKCGLDCVYKKNWVRSLYLILLPWSKKYARVTLRIPTKKYNSRANILLVVAMVII